MKRAERLPRARNIDYGEEIVGASDEEDIFFKDSPADALSQGNTAVRCLTLFIVLCVFSNVVLLNYKEDGKRITKGR